MKRAHSTHLIGALKDGPDAAKVVQVIWSLPDDCIACPLDHEELQAIVAISRLIGSRGTPESSCLIGNGEKGEILVSLELCPPDGKT
jgi:hypothetical protein